MCLSLFLAQVIGCYLFLLSLAMLVHQQRFKKVSSDLLSNAALITLSGTVKLALGLMLVIDHNIWVADWPVAITLVGWILLIQGIMKLFFPEAFAKMSKDLHGKPVHTLLCWARLVIGIYLIWAGFSQA